MKKDSNFDFARTVSQSALRIVSKKELAKLLGVSLRTVYRMIKSHQLPPPLKSPKGYTQGWLCEEITNWSKQQRR